MARFVDLEEGYVEDTVTGKLWQKVPTAPLAWKDLPDPSILITNLHIPTLDELKGLIDGQREDPESFAEAFGEDNAPVEWYWVHKIDPGREAEWLAAVAVAAETEALAEKLSLEKPGHVAAWFNYEGNEPWHRRLLKARCRFVQS
jgi:hypothetical protein